MFLLDDFRHVAAQSELSMETCSQTNGAKVRNHAPISIATDTKNKPQKSLK
jgi:hypothetical protein